MCAQRIQYVKTALVVRIAEAKAVTPEMDHAVLDRGAAPQSRKGVTTDGPKDHNPDQSDQDHCYAREVGLPEECQQDQERNPAYRQRNQATVAKPPHPAVNVLLQCSLAGMTEWDLNRLCHSGYTDNICNADGESPGSLLGVTAATLRGKFEDALLHGSAPCCSGFRSYAEG